MADILEEEKKKPKAINQEPPVIAKPDPEILQEADRLRNEMIEMLHQHNQKLLNNKTESKDSSMLSPLNPQMIS